MKFNKITSSAAALAFAALVGTTAQATPPLPANGDLVIGFEEFGSNASSNVYEVDLGSASLFLTPGQTTQTFNLSDADLDNLFGNNYAGNSALQFGIVGSNASGGDTTLNGDTVAQNELFVSWNTFATAPKALSTGGTNTEANYAGFLLGDLTGSAGTTSTNSTSLYASTTSTSDPDSFYYLYKNRSQ